MQMFVEMGIYFLLDREKLIKGKCVCYLGIYQFVSGKLKEGVKFLKDVFLYLDGIIGQFVIFKVLVCQIFFICYEFENRL